MAARGARRWASTNVTQQRILHAAIDVFSERGFHAATISDIVKRSGDSAGSIYHHFGSKDDLFFAILAFVVHDHDRRIATALQTEPTFDSWARAYLESIWVQRRAAMVLNAGDGPKGFERHRREVMAQRCKQWLPEFESWAQGVLIGQVIIAIMTEAAVLVADSADIEAASAIIDATIRCVEHVTTQPSLSLAR